MEWSASQDKALQAAADWFHNSDEQVFRMFGYAGTGKTTLAKHLAATITTGLVYFAAFTGKAAHVLKQKGCDGATTIHSLIYQTRGNSQTRLKELELQLMHLRAELSQQGLNQQEINDHRRVKDFIKLIEEEKTNIARPSFVLNLESPIRDAKLVIIDECSMVDKQMGEDLLSFGVKVLVLGDPAQLPPIFGAGYFTENVKPDVMLQEIHRQAKDNPIIDLATRVRLGQSLPLGQYGESKVINKEDLNSEDVLLANQLLVGRNETRFLYNQRMRQLKEFKSAYPEINDRIVCLRNNHEVGLLNGGLWKVLSVTGIEGDRIIMTIESEEGDKTVTTEAFTAHFLGKGKEILPWERRESEEFDFGYALTCHKAQGSQWDNVMVFDESMTFKEDRYRWLYTAITRAAEKVTVVRV